MRLRVVFMILLLTIVLHGIPDPTPPELIGNRNGRSNVEFNRAHTVKITTVVNSIVSCINVFLSWVSFLIPPSNMRARLTVLMTAFIVQMSIITNVFSNLLTSEEETLVRFIFNMIQHCCCFFSLIGTFQKEHLQTFCPCLHM